MVIKITLVNAILDFLDVTAKLLPALVLTTLVTMVGLAWMVRVVIFVSVPQPLMEFSVTFRKIYVIPTLAKMVRIFIFTCINFFYINIEYKILIILCDMWLILKNPNYFSIFYFRWQLCAQTWLLRLCLPHWLHRR